MTMLVDTDVLIWHLRGLPRAIQRLDTLASFRISAVTWLELLQGFRNRAEMMATKESLQTRHVERLPITPVITARATGLMEAFALSHGLRMGDALIAATALEHGLTVLTANIRHFSPIANLRIEKFEPQEPAPLAVHEKAARYGSSG